MSAARAVTVAVLAAGVAACSGKGKVREPAELQAIAEPKVLLERQWSTDVGDGAGRYWTGLRLAVADDAVYAAGIDGRVTALDVATGRRLWQVDTGARLISGPVLSGPDLLLGTLDAEVIALSASDGSERWRSTLSSEVIAPPVGDGTTVVARTVDGRIFALSQASGQRRWVFDRNVPTLTLRGQSPPLLFAGAAIIGHDNGRISAVRLADGSPIWEQVVAIPSGRTELDRITDIDAPALIVGDRVAAVSFGGELVNLDLRSGEAGWRRGIRSYTGMTRRGERLYVTDEAGTLWGLELSNGAAAFQRDALAWRGLTRPVLHGDVLVFGDFEGYLHVADPEDGTLIGRARSGSARLVDAPVPAGDRLLVYTADGKVQAWRLRRR